MRPYMSEQYPVAESVGLQNLITRFVKPFLLVTMLSMPLSVLVEQAYADGKGTVAEAVVQQESQGKDNEKRDNKKNEETSNKVERMVWPFTRWIEKKVQDTPLVHIPKNGSKSPTKPKAGVIDLRTAIQRATTVYPGTVLNAEKKTQNGDVTYQIRIISDKGVVKTIPVDGN